ncbi:MAG: trigger factor [Thermoanaerobaculales bacterium]|nr:trigger factor [Thermoanaerobaculales bacterium]
MPYKITKHPNHSVEIDANLESSVVDEERQKVARTFRNRARVPGFRPGKAPLSAVQARYADEIREDLTEKLVEILWRQIVDEEENFEPLTRPEFEEVKISTAGDFSLRVRLEVRPHLELLPIDGVELPEVLIEVTPAEVDAELDKICSEQATWEPAQEDAVVVDGVLVEADLTAVVDGADEEPKTEENAQLIVGDPGVPPEISEALQGAKVGDERVGERKVQTDGADEDADETKVAHYNMVVKAIKLKQLPELDDALAQGFGLEDLDELKMRIKESVTQQKESARRDGWRRTALDHLEKDLDAENLPPALVTDAVNEDLQRFAYSLAMQGQTPNGDQLDWQALRARFEPEARRRALDTLVLEQLAREWEIPVPEDDVNDYVSAEAQRKGIPAAEHRAGLESENQLERIRHSALMAKTVSEMLARAGAEEGA